MKDIVRSGDSRMCVRPLRFRTLSPSLPLLSSLLTLTLLLPTTAEAVTTSDSPTVRITALEKENSSLKRQVHALKVDHELLEERLARLSQEFELLRQMEMRESISSSSMQEHEVARLQELELELQNLKVRTLSQYEALTKQLTHIAQAISVEGKIDLSSSPNEEGEVYIVRAGDTLERIARRYGVTIKQLKEYNQLSSDKIIVGRKLKIPPQNHRDDS